MITDKPINLGEVVGAGPSSDCGGTAIFIGRVRDHDDGKTVARLFYECYRPMAEKQIGGIIRTLTAETGAKEIRVIHRIGWLEVGEIAVVVVASGAHREEAFRACRRTIDRIKLDVPIWKKEIYGDLTQEWVACRAHSHPAGYG